MQNMGKIEGFCLQAHQKKQRGRRGSRTGLDSGKSSTAILRLWRQLDDKSGGSGSRKLVVCCSKTKAKALHVLENLAGDMEIVGRACARPRSGELSGGDKFRRWRKR